MPSTAVLGSTTEVNARSISLPHVDELNDLKELLRADVTKPIFAPLSEGIGVVTVETVKATWKEFLELTRGSYSSIMSSPASEERAKRLVAEIYTNNPSFSKTSQFKDQCEEFLA